MSWIQKLYETYELADIRSDAGDESALLPISHVSQQAHIEITLDGAGNFRRAELVAKENTLTAATEDSAGRSSGGAPHPLNDKIQYVAGDYSILGGRKSPYFEDFKSGNEIKDGYLTLLTKWNSFLPNPKLKAVLSYVERRSVVKDLIDAGILHLDSSGSLVASWDSDGDPPPIFKYLAKKKENEKVYQDQGDAFVRWRVEIEGVSESRTWADDDLVNSWIEYNSKLQTVSGLCYVRGEEQSVGTKHPARLRHGGDKAKLISSNDTSGFTYLGRFTNSEQACAVGYETSQKAHAALRWLIQRQAFRNDDQVVVAWEISGKDVPSPLRNTKDTFIDESSSSDDNTRDEFDFYVEGASDNDAMGYDGDFGQLFARKLSAKIAGYSRTLGSAKDIVIIGLDSSTPGRMAITYYRELAGSEFLARLESWHENFAWFQNYGKEMKFIGAPSPKEIAEAAFGRRLDKKVSKMTVNRLLPCIIDGSPFPQDLIKSTRNRAANRIGMEHWEWEKVLGIACALYRGFNKDKGGYKMALETERISRDYLYGRLLAVAERLEYIALGITGENRDTNAAKLMHRFAERPYSTWAQIEKALVPYKTRLQSRRAGFLANMKNLIDEIHCMFMPEDYTSDAPLSGEFLLGYHCQRHDLKLKSKDEENPSPNDTNIRQEVIEDVTQ
jgi:CRISPR-associated protein Csd1